MATQMAGPAELVVDVSAALPFDEPTSIVASVHLPDPEPEGPHAVLICWPGGSYARSYWEMEVPGYQGYSFAAHMTALGFVVIAADHLGVGASSKPADGDRVNFETMSAAAAAFVDQVRARLRTGSPELGGRPLPSVPIIGVGHSLGACLAVVAQAEHRCYDAVVLLGFTHGRKDVAVGASADGSVDDAALRATAIDQARGFFGDTWDDLYGFAPREPNHVWLHQPDVPAQVIAADDEQAVRWPRQSYVEALLAGYSATFAAKLECRAFLGFGDHDIPPTPHDDVAFYPASNDVTLYVLHDSAHCHNFASTRAQLWDRIALWAST